MGRRTLISALTAITLIVGLADTTQAEDPKAAPAKAAEYEWVFVYYMSYDNNLEGAGAPILRMLKAGITTPNTALVCFADFRREDGMRRYVITSKGMTEERLSIESSAEESTLADCLSWVTPRFKAKKYGVVFLNHGGAQGQMCYDEHPGPKSKQKWLYPPKVADVLTRWRAKVPGVVELLFLQQCGRGSIANMHAFRKSARYVMASQTVVGAPNYYYTKTLKDVGANPKLDGLALAQKIARYEPANMYTTYTTMDAKALEAVPAQLDKVLAPLLEKPLERKKVVAGMRSWFGSPGEQFFDGLALLERLYTTAKVERAPLDAFRKWVKSKLVVQHRVSPSRRAAWVGAHTWSGFSIFTPSTVKSLTKRYRGTYPLYQVSKLDELLLQLLGVTPLPQTTKKDEAKEGTTLPAGKKKKKKKKETWY